MQLYVGNLVHSMTEAELRALFVQHGQVGQVNIISDHFTRQSKGFGYVEMPDSNAGRIAMQALNGKLINQRYLAVREARPRDLRLGRGW